MRETGADVFEWTERLSVGVETIDARPAPTSVTVYTGSDRGDKVSVRQRAVATNAALTDARVTRGLVVADPPPQPRHMRSTRAKTLARAEQEGRRVILDAMRAFRTYRLTVRGHGQLVGGVRTLYAVNTVARVYDDLCTNADGQPLDEDMLITRVTFKNHGCCGHTFAAIDGAQALYAASCGNGFFSQASRWSSAFCS